jgi:hypothetical protein
MAAAQAAMQGCSMWSAARTDTKHVMPAPAVARQLNLDANERVRVLKHVELKD